MLIDPALQAAISAGNLIPVRPIAPWAPEPRALLMCVPLRDAIEAGKIDASGAIRQRWAKLEAAMQFFVEGGYMTERLIKQLRPPKFEHWEIINKKSRPSLRVFGRFAKPDVYIGTHVEYRILLKGMWSQEFEMEKLKCEEHWKAAGLPTVPFLGAFTDFPSFRYEKYITENASRNIEV